MKKVLRTAILAGIAIGLGACAKAKSQAMIEERCAKCHPYEKIYGNRPADKWPEVVAHMRELSPSLLSEDEARQVTKYLQEDFKG